jgi:dynein heavy chain
LPAVFDRNTIYDYVYYPDTQTWKSWQELVNKDESENFPKGTLVQNIVVTTIDTIRYSFIQEYCIQHKIPTIFCGPTGTGKSVYIQEVLLNRLPKDMFDTIEIGFSAQT